ncbi:ABC transporter transmembrane domain-containing protein [uncultured Alsobacter sp.]|uniref:ABC transporter transmembrane domain-containing protein n=1 Tax=uncultured Alsobacter sp. TaxID=1748258 RepID=UPI0025D56EE3|nr:ABC transporter transmembrane domain-containing protein [uncultured Alsobacter sp.]
MSVSPATAGTSAPGGPAGAASGTTGSDARADRTSLRSLLPLLPYALRYRGRIVAALIALVMASGATLIIPMAVRRIIDYGFQADQAALIDQYFGVMIAVVGVLACASAARYYLVMTLGERVMADVRSAVFDHLTRLDPGFYDTVKSGEIVSRLTADTTQIKSAFGASASVALRNLVLFIGAIVMMVITSPKLSGLVLLAIPVIVLPLVASGRSVRQRSRLAQDRLADASAYATEAVGATRVMQAFTAERSTVARFARAAEDAFETARAATLARSMLTAVAIFLIFASVVAVLWYGAQDVMADRITAGRLSQFVLYAVFGAGALGELSQVWSEVSSAAGAAGRIAEILSIEPKIRAPRDPKPLPTPALGTVDFQSVTFAYPTRAEDPVLHRLSFSVASGERVAIVGPSGAGKSTIVQLILRFYDPQSGQVVVDGLPVTDVDPQALRERIAFVPQDPVVFGATVEENIRYGRPHASDAEVQKAAELAAADGFIRALPQGYGSRIGERGVTLSGGQRQRLAIARAILRDAPILLLDEATSALDAESETLVQEALDRLMEGRTTIVIAHRLATVLKADRILVMDGGRIVEEGTHATLVNAGGLYARLARLQFEAGAAALGMERAAE